MKRIAILLSLVFVCLFAIGYRPVLIAMERQRRTMMVQRIWQNQPLIVLDAATRAILVGADRVETFRLVDPDEDQDESQAVVSAPHQYQYLDHHKVLRVGQPQDREFAAAIYAALSKTPSPIKTSRGPIVLRPSGFDPDVGFRVWKGEAHVDICLGLDCGIVEIITKDAHHQIIQQTVTSLGLSRPAFLALSRQTFPQDQALAMKDTL